MNSDRVLQMVGLATKAGKTASGEFSTEKAIKEGNAGLVIVATDASENTKKMFKNKCEFYEIPYMEYGNKESLGNSTGKMTRASLAVTDEGFCKTIINKAEAAKVIINNIGSR